VRKSLRIFEFVSRTKLKRDRDFEDLKRKDEAYSYLTETKLREKEAKSFGNNCQKYERTIEIIKGRTTDFSSTVGSIISMRRLKERVF
jgi:hypothetical protein